jgi:hypothetical protein
MEKLNESTSTNQKNSSGLVTKTETSNQQFSPVTVTPVTSIKSTNIFTYSDCN